MSRKDNGSDQADTLGIEHIDGLYGYAMVLTRNRTDAEDLVQETYLRALPAMAKLRADSNIQGWLFTILRNVWRNQLRQWRNRPRVVEIDADNDAINSVGSLAKDSHDIYVCQLETQWVREAIERLPLKFREIVFLREYEELSYRQIAEVLNCPLGTVMSRLWRARAELRTLLTK
jgi:RNA polymerase sigma-70 factor (ECF subfamily)